ncbi:hypothetical protein AN189_18125 [Loktanella sp. 3ANDIMAR09]|uniref:hypothetical protein n=1 Tax=Loktanella sp. 3ANDIMAR09 TaxID=1225657 RepID=UPI0006FB3391|nr:hypothetical protein [Loktanella sp. 3ANDIMAR09]KQI66972.1 hypothetical protein AN189_18125 [Loktanella sp. 3ANDIMAR09]
MLNKPVEFWLIVAGMLIYVATRAAENDPIMMRAAKAATAGLLGVGGSHEVAPFVRGSEVIAAVLIMAFAQLVLDVATAIMSDREFIKSLVRKRLGGRDE